MVLWSPTRTQHDRMKRAFTISAAWMLATSWLEQVVSVVVFLTIARLVGTEGFGVAAMAFAFLFLGEFLVRDTLTEAIVERRTLEDGRLEATFVALMAFSAILTVVIVLAAKPVAALYGEPAVAPLLVAASPTVLLIGIAGVPNAILRRNLAYRVLAIRTSVGVIAGGVTGVVLALNGGGPWSLVGQRVVEIAVNSVFAWSAARWRPSRWPRIADFAMLRGLGPKVVALRCMTLVILQTPTVALGIFANTHAAGIYSVAARLIEQATALIIKPLLAAAQSAIAALRRERGSTSAFYLDLNEVAALGGFTAFAGLALVAQPLVMVMLGPEWSPAAQVLPILCIAGALTALTAIQEAYLLALNRLGGFLTVSMVEAAVGVVLVMTAGRHGAAAVALAVAARSVLSLGMRTFAALRPEAIPYSSLVRTLAAPLGVAAGVVLVVSVWRYIALGHVPDLLFVALAVVFGVAVAAALLLTLMPGAVTRLRSFTQLG